MVKFYNKNSQRHTPLKIWNKTTMMLKRKNKEIP